MRKVKFHLDIGLCGCDHNEEVEYQDDVGADEIDEDFREWRNGYIEAYWVEVDE